jgi:hypothetical protein
MAFNLEDYETVESRLEKWHGIYPDGRIETEILEHSDTRFIVVCKLFKTEADSKPCASGVASETITDRGVNATSALENCETSAIGRALANAGFAAKGKRPSRSEMDKVNRVSDFKPKYGSPGSKSAAMEMALHIVDQKSKSNDDPITPVEWSVGETVAQIGEVVDVSFTCRHGSMVKKEGIAKATNKPYAGYVCSAAKPDQCDAKWAKLTAAGTWYWPDDSEPGKGGE